MTTAIIEKRKFTYEDYLKTPEDKRYSLIEGELFMTPAPITYHQRISKKIYYELEKFIRDKKMGEVFYAPYDIYLDNENVFQPDVLFVSKDRLNIIGEKNIQGAPDLVIEILSESTAYMDFGKKKRLYAKFGVKEYWIVDPQERIVELYSLKDNMFAITNTYTEKDILKSPLINIEIKLSDIFSF
ncbi:MAG: Uma2 family endonuclease [Candidatus Firestonebacteria bacterium]|nr:Uma2 family endonuclease [Candidatus Firestonebacteria bacterium]